MKEIAKYTAEVLERGERRIRERRKKLRRALLTCIPLCLVAAVLISYALQGPATLGLVPTVKAQDLMEGIEPEMVLSWIKLEDGSEAATDFAVRLFRESVVAGENSLISPFSVLCALGMTANGAEGETLSQMEAALGMSRDDLNTYVYRYKKTLNDSLKIANSVWFRDNNFTANQQFLQNNADHYGAGAYKAPFDDSTLRDINSWVKENTNGMIPSILDSISKDAVMYLINALCFDAHWSEVYEEDDVKEGTFTKEDGTEQKAELMYSTEYKYIEDELATGFMKYYIGGYYFVALLPKEGVTVEEYVNSLEGESLYSTLTGYYRYQAKAALPKFETEFSTEMSSVLAKMGMTDAFNGYKADFSGIGSAEGNIYINSVLHKTAISVDENGTKAAAATSVELKSEYAPSIDREKIVYLDRPFVYMIVDSSSYVPLFIGTMMDIEA